jgi:hypothetical protein
VVDPTHTRTHALELALKRQLKAEAMQAADRGSHLPPPARRAAFF